MKRGDLGAARQAIREGRADGASVGSMQAVEAKIAVHAGLVEDARRILENLENVHGLNPLSLMAAAGAGVRIGELGLAKRFLERQVVKSYASCMVRLDPDLYPLLDHAPFAPRRWDTMLVWPLQAPMIDEEQHALFREVRIETGKPHGSDVLRGLTLVS